MEERSEKTEAYYNICAESRDEFCLAHNLVWSLIKLLESG